MRIGRKACSGASALANTRSTPAPSERKAAGAAPAVPASSISVRQLSLPGPLTQAGRSRREAAWAAEELRSAASAAPDQKALTTTEPRRVPRSRSYATRGLSASAALAGTSGEGPLVPRAALPARREQGADQRAGGERDG